MYVCAVHCQIGPYQLNFMCCEPKEQVSYTPTRDGADVEQRKRSLDHTLVVQKLRGYPGKFPGSFRKGVRVPIGVPGGGVWGRVQEGGGPRFSCGK